MSIPCRHVSDPLLGQGSVLDGQSKIVAPKSCIRHRHVKASLGACNATVLGVPVRNDEALKVDFCLEEAVQQLAVLATVGIVQPVVRAL